MAAAARILELNAQAKAKKDELDALIAPSRAEKRSLNAEEVKTAEGIQKDLSLVAATLAAEQVAGASAPVFTPPAPAITGGAPAADADPKRGFRSHREFLMGVLANAGLRDRSDISDERLKPLAVFDKDDKVAKGELAYLMPLAFTPASMRAAAGSDEQGEYDNRYGGLTVQKSRLPGLMSIGFEGDPTAGRTQPLPMQTPSVDINARVDKDHSTSVSGGLAVTRRPETVAATSSRMSTELITMKASGLFGLSYASEELLADSPLSWIAILDAGYRTQFGAHILNEKITGAGGSEYLGILTALSTSAGNTGPTLSIAKETNQTAATITYNNTINMVARGWGLSDMVWLANPTCRPQLIKLAIPVGVGGTLVYQPSPDIGFPDRLHGIPIYYTEFCKAVGTVGDLILANMSQYLEGVYQPIQSAESAHVRFVQHERTFKFWTRNCGAPWWKSVLTPKNGDTLSPFVVLATRS